MKKNAIIVLLLALLVGVLWLSLSWRYQQPAEQAAQETDKPVKRIEETAREFTRATEAHKAETTTKVVVIREKVKKEIAALDPDGLADAALGEIELFRRSAGGGAETSAAGVDGGN